MCRPVLFRVTGRLNDKQLLLKNILPTIDPKKDIYFLELMTLRPVS